MAASSSAEIKQLQLQISASTELLSRNLKTAEQQVRGFASDVERDAERADNALSSIGSGLKGLLGGVSAIALTRSFLDIADQAKQIDAQLRLATASSGNFGRAQEDVKRIAAETRNELGAIATLYGNFVRSSEAVGKGQTDAARATETFSKALKLGGADASAAAGATLQFGQALASGVLRGDEFNSIMEASPRIARLLADSLGIPIGQLRAMAEEGKLTSDVLYRALTEKKFTDGIDAEFRQLPVTFDEALTAVHNKAITVFGAFDRGGEFSTIIAQFVAGGADEFGKLETAAEHFGIEARAIIEGLGGAFGPLETEGGGAIDFLRDKWRGFRDEIADLLGAIDSVRNFGRDWPSIIGPKDGVIGRTLAPYMGKPGPAADSKGAFLAAFDRAEAQGQVRAGVGAIERSFGSYGYGGTLAGRTLVGEQPTKPIPVTPSGGGAGGSSKKKTASPKDTLTLTPSSKQFAGLLDAPTADEQLSRFYRSIDIDPNRDLAAIREEIDQRKEAENEVAEYERNLQRETWRMGEHHVRDLASLFEDEMTGRAGSFWEQFKHLGLQAVGQVVSRLLTNNGGQGGGFGAIVRSTGSSLLGSLIGGAFADGGDPPMGKVSLVGERGPELFVPKTPGTIVPNHMLGGGGRTQVETTVHVKASPEFHAQVEQTTVRTVAGAAEPIMAGAQVRTMKAMRRRPLPGGYGG